MVTVAVLRNIAFVIMRRPVEILWKIQPPSLNVNRA
jgi:hypothetical protein